MTEQTAVPTIAVEMSVEDWEMVRHIVIMHLGDEQRRAEPEDRADIRATSRRVWSAITSAIGEAR